MRDFFKSELQTLKAKTGLNQYETFSNMPDAQRQITILLDSMVLACNEFPYIPDDDKKRIIQEQIVRDQDFTALNSRTIWKWLNANKDIYWAKANAKEKDEPIVFEPLSEKTIQLIENFKKELQSENFKPNITQKDVEHEKERIKFEESRNAVKYKTPSAEEIEARELHNEYCREMYDLYTGKPKDNWISESEWLKQRSKI